MQPQSATSPDEPLRRLIGRDPDLQRVRGFIRDASVHGGSLIVRGDAGVGKTSLLEAVAAAASGARVLRAVGSPFEVDVRFAVLSQALSTAHDEIISAPDRQTSDLGAALGLVAARQPSHEATTDETVRLLRRLSRVAPVLVVLDDLQWVDAASADVLAVAAQSLSHEPVAFLAAARSGATTAFDTGGAKEHRLEQLTADNAARLFDARYPHVATIARARVLEQAAGNPFALLELGRSLTAMPRAGSDLPARLPLPARIRQFYEPRVAELSSGVRDLLLLAALYDGHDLRAVVAAASGDTGLGEILAGAVRLELVAVDQPDGPLSFRHPLARNAVVEMSTAADRRRAHARLATILDGDEPPATWHLAEAALHPDERVAARLEKLAADAVLHGETLSGAAALARAADLSPQRSERVRRKALAAYLRADVNGDLASSAPLLGAVWDRDLDPALSLEAATAASYLLLNGAGDVESAHRILLASLDAHAGTRSEAPAAVAETLHNLLEVCLYAGREELWAPCADRLGLVDLTSFPVLALWTATLADPVRTAAAALPELELAVAGLATEESPTVIERVATAAIYVDRVDDARPALWRAVEAARVEGAITAGINAHMLLTVDDFKRGLWDEGLTGVSEGLDWCDTFGYQLLRWPLRLAEGLILGARGRGQDAEAIAGEIDRWALPRGAFGLRNFAWHVRAMSGLSTGAYDSAYDAAVAISAAGTLPPHQGHALWVSMDLVEAAVRSRREAEARAHVSCLNDAGVAALSPRLALLVAGAAAMAGTDLRLFDVALSVEDAGRWPFDLARVQFAYGERLRRARRTVDARTQLAASHAAFIRLDAYPWAERAHRELQATNPQRAHLTVDGGLTPQERAVAALAAAGSTNKQIAEQLQLSPRTVGAHLTRVFAKLGVQTRAGLGAVLADSSAGG